MANTNIPQAQYSVEIMVDTIGVPHTFLRITDANGNVYNRGFIPVSTSLINDGQIDISEHEWNKKSKKMYITEEQFKKLMSDIDNDIKNPPKYDLPNGAQCVTWAMDKLQNSGIVDFGVSFGGGVAETLKTNPYLQAWFGIDMPSIYEEPYMTFLDHHSTIPENFTNPFINVTIQYDPIALDLDADGAISVISANDGSVYFDYDCDGVAFRSSWISSNDGLLVFDRNNNGTIDNGSELFGNFTPKDNGEFAKDGFNALSSFDTNQDGIISNLDENFDKLQIWQDSNSNGISESNELKSLSEFNIESLNLNKFTNLNLFVA